MPHSTSAAGLRSREACQAGIDHEVVAIAASLVVEAAAAGDQAQGWLGDGPEYGVLGEGGLGVLVHTPDGEAERHAVGPLDLYDVTRGELAQAVEDGGSAVGVDVTGDNGGTLLTGKRPASEPARVAEVVRDLQGAVGVEPERDQPGLDSDRFDAELDRRGGWPRRAHVGGKPARLERGARGRRGRAYRRRRGATSP
jgi:hypothetical protein